MIFTLEHSKALYLRFCMIYGDKFTKNYHDVDFKDLWYREWHEGLASVDVNGIKDALSFCRENLEWPPSIAEFRNICLKNSGVPSAAQIMRRAIDGNFEHPLTRMVYDKVGGWAFKQDTEKLLFTKINEVYKTCLSEYSSDTKFAHARHQLLQGTKALPNPDSKILEGATISLPDNDKKLIGNYYLDQIRNNLGKPSKHLTEEERNNVRDIIAKAGVVDDPLKCKTVQEWYDEVTRDRERIAHEMVRGHQLAAKKVEEGQPVRSGSGKPQNVSEYYNRH
jgi:hypothetical protein